MPRQERSRICALLYPANMPPELHEQLILRAGTAGPLDDLDRNTGADELLDQQHLVGELAAGPTR